jgi:hypothetical protein
MMMIMMMMMMMMMRVVMMLMLIMMMMMILILSLSCPHDRYSSTNIILFLYQVYNEGCIDCSRAKHPVLLLRRVSMAPSISSLSIL